ncbi:MAG: TonB family protein [Candidatus Schekmanbacteria bacterium]|nr:TonB family protein [Candidatus Schekmanbacteria bacterium]
MWFSKRSDNGSDRPLPPARSWGDAAAELAGDLGPRFSAMIGLSMVLHLLLVSVYFGLDYRKRPILVASNRVVVSLVGSTSARPQAVPTAKAGPTPDARPAPVSTPRPQPAVKKKDPKAKKKKTPKPVPTAKSTARPLTTAVPHRTMPATAKPVQSPVPDDGSYRFALPELGVAMPGVSASGAMRLDSGDFRFAYYIEALRRKIAANWVPPVGGVMPGHQLRCVVYFRISRQGAVDNVEIEESSGLSPMDMSALRAVLSAAPMPPLPYAFTGNTIGIHFSFELAS